MAKAQQPDLSSFIQASAQRWNIDPALSSSVVQQESSGNPGAINAEGGGQGAYGAMQVRQAALADYNKANGTKYSMQDLLNPKIGVDVGTWYLSQQLDKFNDPAKALIAYKEGAGSPEVSKGTHPYAAQVIGRIGTSASTKNAALPGVPTAGNSASPLSDADIDAAFPRGGKPSAVTAATKDMGFSDAQIDAAFPRQVGNQKPSAAAPTNADQPTSKTPLFDPQSKTATFGAGLGHGFGSIVLGGQQLIGKGLSALGAEKAGNWLVNDANAGLRN
uniref:transglycosylase SLT domain-containing protein n=1 Tax=Cupriavidus basilensis TaxID=68895 RepID=UPI000AC1704A